MSVVHRERPPPAAADPRSSSEFVRLANVSFRPAEQTWLHPMDLPLGGGGVNVLLGATLAGKTSLMRIMAGLERPTTGRLLQGERDLTGVPVRRRNVAMVYQQFINYPSLTVFENIASPLRVARVPQKNIRERVQRLAELLQLGPYLERRPAELSGGQQQRTALARALAKDAELVLLDEPFANLDYKLREELREELRGLVAHGRSTFVYATTEPGEALQLGGACAVLVEGRLVQQGPTLEVFRRPRTLAAARAFSDPPLSELRARVGRDATTATLSDGVELRLPAHAAAALLAHPSQEIVLAVRAHQFSVSPEARGAAFSGRVDLAEISGSHTYVHVSHGAQPLVAQLPGVHQFELGERCTLHVDVDGLYGFALDGALLFAPQEF